LLKSKGAVEQEINSVANQGITGVLSQMIGFTKEESSADLYHNMTEDKS